jgi:hypothetical protein
MRHSNEKHCVALPSDVRTAWAWVGRSAFATLLCFLLVAVSGCEKKEPEGATKEKKAKSEDESPKKEPARAAGREDGKGEEEEKGRPARERPSRASGGEEARDVFPRPAPIEPRPGGRKVKLRLQLEKGKKYRFRMVTDQKIHQEIMGRKQDMSQTMGMGTTFDVKKVSPEKDFTIDVTYHWVRFLQKGPQGTVDYDSSKPGGKLDKMAKVFAALEGKGFTVVLSSLGKVKNVSGAKKLLNGVLESIELPSGRHRQVVKKQLEQRFSDSALKKMMENVFAVYPEKAVGVGSSWQKKAKSASVFPMEIYTTYTLAEIKERKAIIQVDSRVKSLKGGNMGMGPLNLSYAISGTQKGKVVVDLKTGLTVGTKLEQDLSGKVTMKKAAGQKLSWPIEIESTVRVLSEKKSKAPAARKGES